MDNSQFPMSPHHLSSASPPAVNYFMNGYLREGKTEKPLPQEPKKLTMRITAPAPSTQRKRDVDPLCPDTDWSQRNVAASCHWPFRRSIWYCLAGDMVSRDGRGGRAGWQTEPGHDPWVHWSEPRGTRSWLSSSSDPCFWKANRWGFLESFGPHSYNHNLTITILQSQSH